MSAVLLCGPCDSGKTTLFSQLLHGKPMETYTSMKVNVGGSCRVPVGDICRLSSRTIWFIDSALQRESLVHLVGASLREEGGGLE